MNHPVRVGGSVFASLILERNSSFDISHLIAKPGGLSGKQKAKKERGLCEEEMLVSMATWSMCLCV